MPESYIRRLPIYLLLDISESMAGSAIESVEKGVRTLVDSLRSNPMALETAYISVITFARKAEVAVPLTELMKFTPPKLSVRAGSNLGSALRLLVKTIKADILKSTATTKGDYKPLVFLLTDGQPTDDWEAAAAELKQHNHPKIANLYAIGCGLDVDPDVLREISDIVLMMNDLSPEGFRKFFVWLSASVQTASVKPDGEQGLERLPEGLSVPKESETYGVGGPRQVFLQAVCQKTNKPYLMRYARRERDGIYEAIAAHPLDVYEKDAGDYLPPVNTAELDGVPGCPHCENQAMAYCRCTALFCFEPGSKRTVPCPCCHQPFTPEYGNHFDVRRTSG